MKLTLLADERDLVRLACEGEIGDEELIADREPMAGLLGPLGGFRRKVLLNLERATIIYSEGINWLLHCRKHFLQEGGVLVLYSIPPLVEQPLKLVKLQKILPFARDEAEARKLALEEKP